MVGGWVGGGAQERLVTPGEGRTLSTLAGDDRRMNAGFEEAPCGGRKPPAANLLLLRRRPGPEDGRWRVLKTHQKHTYRPGRSVDGRMEGPLHASFSLP